MKALTVIQAKGFARIGKYKLYYESYSSNLVSKTTLLTLHGGPGFTHHQLLPLTWLAGKQPPVRVILYDQLGCGSSDRAQNLNEYKIMNAVDDIEAFRKKLGLGRLSLLGHSYGGSLALEYALKYQNHIERLVLSSSSASIPKTIMAFQRLKAEMPVEIKETLRKYEDSGDYDNPEYKRVVNELYKKHVFRGEQYPPDLAASLNGFNPDVYWTMWGKHEFVCTGNMRKWDVSARLHEVRVSTLILVGRYDELPVELSEEMHQLIRNSKLTILENSSHFGMFEEQERYLQTVYSFLIN